MGGYSVMFLVDTFTRFEIGDPMLYSVDKFKTDPGIGFKLAGVSRNRKTGEVFIKDENGNKYPADQCRFVHPECLTTALTIVESIIATDGQDYDLLQSLEPEHKAILWRSLTLDQRKALSEIKARLDQKILANNAAM